MNWTAVRVAGPGSIGLALVILRPSWVSVVTLALLLIVAMWFDGQERRADDIEDMAEELRGEMKRHAESWGRLGNMIIDERDGRVKAQEEIRALATLTGGVASKAHDRIKELEERLDVAAQQRKGPSL